MMKHSLRRLLDTGLLTMVTGLVPAGLDILDQYQLRG